VAGRAEDARFAAEGDEEFGLAAIAAHPGEALFEDAAFEELLDGSLALTGGKGLALARRQESSRVCPERLRPRGRLRSGGVDETAYREDDIPSRYRTRTLVGRMQGFEDSDGAEVITQRGMVAMRRSFFVFLLLVSTSAGAQGAGGDDPVAVQILDHMSAVIGELNSCAYTLKVARDVDDPDLGLVKRFAVHEVFMMGPDKMLVNSRGTGGHKGYWYDGETVTYYSYDENNFATVKAPGTTVETIDAMHRDYDIDFPAADFFYPKFTDDLIDSTDRIVFLGNKELDGKSCFHLYAMGQGMSVQLWIADDALNLPVKLVISYLDQRDAPQYEATFSDWQINPELPVAIFDFVPPRSAAPITLVSKTGK